MTRRPFLAIAHRGASGYAPENTMAAFDLALAMGARDLELDVHLTADRQLVVIHDATLDRTTNGSGPVAALPLAGLKRLDAGSWFDRRFAGERLPTFHEVLARYAGRAHIHAEIKVTDAGPLMVEAICAQGLKRQVTLTAFEAARLAAVRAMAPDLPTGWLVKEVGDEVVATARRHGFTQICPRAAELRAETVDLLHDAGFAVRAWGVTSDDDMRHVLRTGADGMTSNHPDRLLDLLRAK